MAVNRRDFLMLRVEPARATAVLSCEHLYMRWVDARAEGATAALFDRLASDLAGVKTLRLIKTSWLADADLRRQLEAALEPLRSCGGRVEH